MSKMLFIICALLLVSASASVQPKTKPPAKATVTGLQKMLSATRLPFRMVNDSVAVIPYESEHIDSYAVVVLTVSDLVVVYTNLPNRVPSKIDASKYGYLLGRNEHFEIIKLCMEVDKQVYVRADAYRTSATTPLFTRIIKQVANVTNIISGKLKQGNQ